jgi:hypothetical protein
MPHRRTLLVLSAAVTLALAAPAAAQPPGLIPTVSKIRADGIGAFTVGMTPRQARRAAGGVYHTTQRVGGCTYWDFGPPGTPQGPFLRFQRGRIRYVDVGRRQFKTKRGVEVGNRVGKVRRKYNGLHRHADIGGGYRLAVRFHKYRLVFSIAGRKVSRIAGGRGRYALQQECS